MHNRIQQQKKRNERFKEEQIVMWLAQALLGLKHLHERHILHRGKKLCLPLTTLVSLLSVIGIFFSVSILQRLSLSLIMNAFSSPLLSLPSLSH